VKADINGIGSTNSLVSGSFLQGFRSALASGNSNLNRFTTVAILLASSRFVATSAAFTRKHLWCEGKVEQRVIVTTSDLELHCSSAEEINLGYGALPVDSVIDSERFS